MSAPQRPNILLITTDQQRHDHLGAAGMPGIPTPHLDRLATEGIRFTRAYCPSPICTPARVSMLTGLYPSSHGAYTIGVTADPFPEPTLPDVLGRSGYATSLFGKSHFVRRADEAAHVIGRENPEPEAFRDFHGPYVGFERVATSTGHTINARPDMHYRIFLEDAGVDYAPWFPQMGEHYDHHRVGRWEIPEEYHDTHWVGELTCDYIREQAAAEDGRPWFCWTSFQDPHEPFVCPDPWYGRVNMDGVAPFPPEKPGEFDDKPAFYREGPGIFKEEAGVPCVYRKPQWMERADEALRATLGMVGFIDDRVGRMLAELERTGQADNTIVIFTSDHGEMHGHHGYWGKGLTAYEDCQRVPLLVWGPRFVQRRGATDALANLVDLPRTILGWADTPEPVGLQGADLRPICAGEANTVRDATLIECRATERTVYQQTMVTDRHKLVVYRDDDAGELYDLKRDPDQYENLWDRLEHADLKRDLLLRFARLQMEREGRVAPRKSFA